MNGEKRTRARRILLRARKKTGKRDNDALAYPVTDRFAVKEPTDGTTRAVRVWELPFAGRDVAEGVQVAPVALQVILMVPPPVPVTEVLIV
jgi:hypothetical protein